MKDLLRKDLTFGEYFLYGFPKTNNTRWNFVVKHNIQLPDEYDSILEDLKPFYGLDPSDLIKIHDEIKGKSNSYVVGKNETVKTVSILTHAFKTGKLDEFVAGARELIKVFELIQDDLPNFRMPISPLGIPNRMSDYRVKQAALDAVAGGTRKRAIINMSSNSTRSRYRTFCVAETHREGLGYGVCSYFFCSTSKRHQFGQSHISTEQENFHS